MVEFCKCEYHMHTQHCLSAFYTVGVLFSLDLNLISFLLIAKSLHTIVVETPKRYVTSCEVDKISWKKFRHNIHFLIKRSSVETLMVLFKFSVEKIGKGTKKIALRTLAMKILLVVLLLPYV